MNTGEYQGEGELQEGYTPIATFDMIVTSSYLRADVQEQSGTGIAAPLYPSHKLTVLLRPSAVMTIICQFFSRRSRFHVQDSPAMFMPPVALQGAYLPEKTIFVVTLPLPTRLSGRK